MKNLDKANEWLQRAKSNMARAKAGRVSTDILNEDLCYDPSRLRVHKQQKPGQFKTGRAFIAII